MLVALAILFGTLSRVWAGDELVHVGPPGVETCVAVPSASGPPGPIECKPEANATLPTDIAALRWIVLIGGFASAAVCAFSGLQLSRETTPPLRLATAILAATALAMLAFELRLLTSTSLSIGIGFPAGLGGVVAGGVLVHVLARRA